ncbi:MAG TPA: tetratricopeptide repeat protein, partial [Polyangiaceae bacterium]|nr:tetratricopeptide repeat protein [Polyangiaceae bacterium]
MGFRSTSRIASLLLTATAFAWIAPAGPIGGEATAFAQSASKSREDKIKEGTVALEVAKLAEQKGRNDVAAESALIALENFESAYGKSHPKTREAAEVLERIVRKMGRKDVADEIKKRFLTSSSPSPSPTPTPTPAPSKPTREDELNQVLREAVKAQNEGRDADSARAFERLLAMLESDGKGSDATGRGARSKLAFAYDRMLQFAKAEPLLRRNVELAEAARPQDPIAVDDAREALALHFLVAGQHDRSLALYEQVLRSKEGSSRVAPADMAMLMLQMAGLQQSLDHHDESKRYVDRAMKIAVEGSLSGPIVQSISLMAGTIYSKIGEYEDAEQLLEASVAAAIRMDSGDGRTLDTPLSALAWHYRSRGKYEEAEKAWLKVLQLRERSRSSRSSDTAMTLNQLAELYWVWGKKTDQIMPMALRASDIDEANVASVLQGGSEEQKAAFIERYVQGTDRIVSYHLSYAKTDADAARLAINTVLRRKGRVLDAVSDGIRLLRQRMSSSDRELLDKVGKVRERLASLSLAGPPKSMSPDEYRSTLASLEREELQLQTELAGKSASYRAETEPTTFEKVRALLPAD